MHAFSRSHALSLNKLVGGPKLILSILGSGLRIRLHVLARPFWMSLSLSAPMQQEDWVQGEDEERSSSDGRGSSYFSGERLDQIHSSSASPMRSQQSSRAAQTEAAW